MEKEENGCRSPSTASSSSESYWGWEWRRTSLLREYMNWTCVYCNLLYTSCIAWVITLATEIRQNEPPWASETSSDMWSPRGDWRCYAPLAPWGDHISLLFLLSSRGFIHVSPSYRRVILCTNHLLQGVSPLLYISITQCLDDCSTSLLFRRVICMCNNNRKFRLNASTFDLCPLQAFKP